MTANAAGVLSCLTVLMSVNFSLRWCRFADKNPLEILLIFMGEQNLRLVDLFRSFDKDQSGGLTRDEFIVGLQVCWLD